MSKRGDNSKKELIDQLVDHLYEEGTPIPIQIQIFNMIVESFRQYKIGLIVHMRIMLEIIQKDETSLTIFERCCNELVSFMESKSTKVQPHIEMIMNSLLNRVSLLDEDDESKLSILVKIIVHLSCLLDHKSSMERLISSSQSNCVKHIVRVAPKTIYGLMLKYPKRNIPSILRLFSPLWVHLLLSEKYLEERKSYFLELSKIGVRTKNRTIFEYFFRWIPMLGQGVVKSSEDLIHSILIPMEITWDYFLILFPPDEYQQQSSKRRTKEKGGKSQLNFYFDRFFRILITYLWELNDRFELSVFEPLINKIFRYLMRLKYIHERVKRRRKQHQHHQKVQQRSRRSKYDYKMIDDEGRNVPKGEQPQQPQQQEEDDKDEFKSEYEHVVSEIHQYIVVLNILLLKSHNIEFLISFLSWIFEICMFSTTSFESLMMTINTLLYISTLGLLKGSSNRKSLGKLHSVKKKIEEVMIREQQQQQQRRRISRSPLMQHLQQQKFFDDHDDGDDDDDAFISSLLSIDDHDEKQKEEREKKVLKGELDRIYLSYEIRVILKCFKSIIKSPYAFLHRLSSPNGRMSSLVNNHDDDEENERKKSSRFQFFCPSLIILSLGVFLNDPMYENTVMKESLGYVSSTLFRGSGNSTQLSMYLQPLVVKKLRDNPKNALEYLYLICSYLTRCGSAQAQGGEGNSQGNSQGNFFFVVRAAQSLVTSLPKSLRHLKIRLLLEIWKSQKQNQKEDVGGDSEEEDDASRRRSKKSLEMVDYFSFLKKEVHGLFNDVISRRKRRRKRTTTKPKSQEEEYDNLTSIAFVIHEISKLDTFQSLEFLSLLKESIALLPTSEDDFSTGPFFGYIISTFCRLVELGYIHYYALWEKIKLEITRFLETSKYHTFFFQYQQTIKFLGVCGEIQMEEEKARMESIKKHDMKVLKIISSSSPSTGREVFQILQYLKKEGDDDDYRSENTEILSLLWNVLEKNLKNKKKKRKNKKLVQDCVASISKFSLNFQLHHFGSQQHPNMFTKKKRKKKNRKKKKDEEDEDEDEIKFDQLVSQKQKLIELYFEKFILIHEKIVMSEEEEEEEDRNLEKIVSQIFHFSSSFENFRSFYYNRRITSKSLRRRIISFGGSPVSEKKTKKPKEKTSGTENEEERKKRVMITKEYLSTIYLRHNRQVSTIPLFMFNIQPQSIEKYFFENNDNVTSIMNRFYQNLFFRDFCHSKNFDSYFPSSSSITTDTTNNNFIMLNFGISSFIQRILDYISSQQHQQQKKHFLFSTKTTIHQRKEFEKIKSTLIFPKSPVLFFELVFSNILLLYNQKQQNRGRIDVNTENENFQFCILYILNSFLIYFNENTTSRKKKKKKKKKNQSLTYFHYRQIIKNVLSKKIQESGKSERIKILERYIWTSCQLSLYSLKPQDSIIHSVFNSSKTKKKKKSSDEMMMMMMNTFYDFIIFEWMIKKNEVCNLSSLLQLNPMNRIIRKKSIRFCYLCILSHLYFLKKRVKSNIDDDEEKMKLIFFSNENDSSLSFTKDEEKKISKFLDTQIMKFPERWDEGAYIQLIFSIFCDSYKLLVKDDDNDDEKKRMELLIEYILYDVLKMSSQQEGIIEFLMKVTESDYRFIVQCFKFIPLLLSNNNNNEKKRKIFDMYFRLSRQMDNKYRLTTREESSEKNQEIHELKHPNRFKEFHQVINCCISSFLKSCGKVDGEKKKYKEYMLQQIDRLNEPGFYDWVKVSSLMTLSFYFLQIDHSNIVRGLENQKIEAKEEQEERMFMDLDLFLLSLHYNIFLYDVGDQKEVEEKEEIERFLYLPRYNIIYSFMLRHFEVPKIIQEQQPQKEDTKKRIIEEMNILKNKLLTESKHQQQQHKKEEEEEELEKKKKKKKEEDEEEVKNYYVDLVFQKYSDSPSHLFRFLKHLAFTSSSSSQHKRKLVELLNTSISTTTTTTGTGLKLIVPIITNILSSTNQDEEDEVVKKLRENYWALVRRNLNWFIDHGLEYLLTSFDDDDDDEEFIKFLDSSIIPFVFQYFDPNQQQQQQQSSALIFHNFLKSLSQLYDENEKLMLKMKEEEDDEEEEYSSSLVQQQQQIRIRMIVSKIRERIWKFQDENVFIGGKREEFFYRFQRFTVPMIWNWSRYCSSIFVEEKEEEDEEEGEEEGRIIMKSLMMMYGSIFNNQQLEEDKIMKTLEKYIVEEEDSNLVNFFSFLGLLVFPSDQKNENRKKLEKMFMYYLEKYEADKKMKNDHYQQFLMYQFLGHQCLDLFCFFDDSDLQNEIFLMDSSKQQQQQHNYFFFNFLISRFFVNHFDEKRLEVMNKNRMKQQQHDKEDVMIGRKKNIYFVESERRNERGVREEEKGEDMYLSMFMRKLLVSYGDVDGRSGPKKNDGKKRILIVPLLSQILRSVRSDEKSFRRQYGRLVLQNLEDFVLKSL